MCGMSVIRQVCMCICMVWCVICMHRGMYVQSDMYVCIVRVMCCVAYIVVCMYSAVSLYGMSVVWTLYVQCGMWYDTCGVVVFLSCMQSLSEESIFKDLLTGVSSSAICHCLHVRVRSLFLCPSLSCKEFSVTDAEQEGCNWKW